MRTIISAVACVFLAASLQAAELSGQYVEARTCDVWTGACFANAEMNLTGYHAVLAWKFDKGRIGDVKLDGLSVVAVIEASDTLGLPQRGPAKAVLLVDKNADTSQREALIQAAKRLGGKFTENVVAVESMPINIHVGGCPEGGCSAVDAGVARIETRCFKALTDKACGHEDNFYPPLARGVDAKSAYVTNHTFVGKGFGKTWSDSQRRGAYVGSFTLKD
ncbi:MAG: DUF1326 domain-containing protein [Gemmatales bacterium]|nr:DUF1326 domain-containing protein [Gemmatales bacterium]MDW8387305.1 DUF1326 domain-containing protein [Gemmatales bacterium]